MPIGASLEDLGNGLRSQIGTIFSSKLKGVRYLEIAEGYVLRVGLINNEPVGYEFLNIGNFLKDVKGGIEIKKAYLDNVSTYGRFEEAEKIIDPRVS